MSASWAFLWAVDSWYPFVSAFRAFEFRKFQIFHPHHVEKNYIGSLKGPYFSVEMKRNQKWFQTDLGYRATIEKLRKLQVAGYHYKGRYTFWLEGLKDVTFQITTKGKLSVTYPENMDYRFILEKVKPHLVKADGSSAKILKEIPIHKKAPNSEIERKIDAELKRCAERHITLVGLEWLANQVGECPERIKEFVYKVAKKYGITISQEFYSYVQFDEQC